MSDDWFCTHSGAKVHILQPDPSVIRQLDIAHALARTCRFNGHVGTFYSVAQHCLLVQHHAPEELKLEALLHDATEAYLGDVIRPLKRLLPAYKKIERQWEAIIAEKYKLDTSPAATQVVKALDRRALITERKLVASAHWMKHTMSEDESGIQGFATLRVPRWLPMAGSMEYGLYEVEDAFNECWGELQEKRWARLPDEGQRKGLRE